MTQLQIINLALVHQGSATLTQSALDNLSDPASLAANVLWEPCRDEVLGSARWSFATVTQTLSVIDNIIDAEYDYVYTHPTLSVGAIWCVFNEGSVDTKEDNEFELRYAPTLTLSVIYTNEADAIAEYTYKVTSPAVWSDSFNMAFSYLLASRMCAATTGDVDKSLKLGQIYSSLISDSKRIGASEKRKKPKETSNYLNAR